MPETPDRNLALDLVRVTEVAAMAAARWMGRGDKESVDQAAVDAMRTVLDSVDVDGVVAIGEGEKDDAPWLANGEKIGSGRGPQVDVAVDPVDGTRLTANGMPGALAVIAIADRGTMFAPGRVVYMDKIAVGEAAAGSIDLDAPVHHNLRQVAKATGKSLSDLTAIVLDRPRNESYIDAIRESGARIRLIQDGDISAAIATAVPDSGIDIMLGIGGSPEAVVAASAMTCLRGEIQGRLWPRDDVERRFAVESGLDLDRVLSTRDLVDSDNVFFSATGVTSGELLDGVRYYGGGAETHTLVMRSKTGTVRSIKATHRLDTLQELSLFPLQWGGQAPMSPPPVGT